MCSWSLTTSASAPPAASWRPGTPLLSGTTSMQVSQAHPFPPPGNPRLAPQELAWDADRPASPLKLYLCSNAHTSTLQGLCHGRHAGRCVAAIVLQYGQTDFVWLLRTLLQHPASKSHHGPVSVLVEMLRDMTGSLTLLLLHTALCAVDVEFGRLQARDLLQHLWTGPISNAPVNIVQGSKSVEVRPVGISKVCQSQFAIEQNFKSCQCGTFGGKCFKMFHFVHGSSAQQYRKCVCPWRHRGAEAVCGHPCLPCMTCTSSTAVLFACLQGLAMQRMLLAMAERNGAEACNFDFVMVAGHFLARDENIFTFFEGQQVKAAEQHGMHLVSRLKTA